ncbi:uncharacterized protein LOC124778105 [Schistocerca piceifrons]|uniref:uncharacterized protein LOC124778105 n=1 Tax=Schistocerca piceifrons TaxID=274613 RepID=UPI001F5EAFD9|nr:uncharacterized protein LOC124778105 [Schistocerca piceifrons]
MLACLPTTQQLAKLQNPAQPSPDQRRAEQPAATLSAPSADFLSVVTRNAVATFVRKAKRTAEACAARALRSASLATGSSLGWFPAAARYGHASTGAAAAPSFTVKFIWPAAADKGLWGFVRHASAAAMKRQRPERPAARQPTLTAAACTQPVYAARDSGRPRDEGGMQAEGAQSAGRQGGPVGGGSCRRSSHTPHLAAKQGRRKGARAPPLAAQPTRGHPRRCRVIPRLHPAPPNPSTLALTRPVVEESDGRRQRWVEEEEEEEEEGEGTPTLTAGLGGCGVCRAGGAAGRDDAVVVAPAAVLASLERRVQIKQAHSGRRPAGRAGEKRRRQDYSAAAFVRRAGKPLPRSINPGGGAARRVRTRPAPCTPAPQRAGFPQSGRASAAVIPPRAEEWTGNATPEPPLCCLILDRQWPLSAAAARQRTSESQMKRKRGGQKYALVRLNDSWRET